MDPPVALVSAARTTPPANLQPTMVVPVFLWETALVFFYSRSWFLGERRSTFESRRSRSLPFGLRSSGDVTYFKNNSNVIYLHIIYINSALKVILY